MSLVDLGELKNKLVADFEKNFSGDEIVLPDNFKRKVTAIGSDSIRYLNYSAIITNKAGQKIYLPNQWFYIASYFTEYYNAITQYRNSLIDIFSKDRLKELKYEPKMATFPELTEKERMAIIEKQGVDNLEYITRFITDYAWWGGAKAAFRGDLYDSPILNMANVVNASHSYIVTLCGFLAENPDLSEILYEFESAERKTNGQIPLLKAQRPVFQSCLTAIRTKPFVLLAGISGIGKSRIVRELAFMSCPDKESLQNDETTPGNYCMIEVKPNWHDSSELLGYASGIRGKYIITPFIKFLVKAMRYPEVPFFICLDEMNLAPVEQYFAEYLSVLETRKKNGDRIVSGCLIGKDVFNEYTDIFSNLGLNKDEDIDKNIKKELTEFGLRLPHNLIVVGTVNMDDTTHQFSRKVIDRAMTIEINHVDFKKMFDDKDSLQYTDEPLSGQLFISDSVNANQALKQIPQDSEELKTGAVGIMQEIDEILRDTPFRVAYRVQNELVLYFRNLRFAYPEKSFNDLFVATVDSMINMKVLPRIEGDEDLVEKPLKALEDWSIEHGLSLCESKIREMQGRLSYSHYTSYWP